LTTGDTETRRRGADFETPASPRSFVTAQEEGGVGEESSRPHDPPSSARASRRSPPHRALSARAGSRLSQILIGKSVLETLFVAALVVYFSYTHFNPRLRGTLDAADARQVAGWVVDEADPGGQVEVELYIDDHFVARRRADESRPDVLAAGRAASAEHGYVFATPPLPAREGEFEARVFAVEDDGDSHRHALSQVGDALRFKVRRDETDERATEKWWESLEKR
jgi:hypothetical protein